MLIPTEWPLGPIDIQFWACKWRISALPMLTYFKPRVTKIHHFRHAISCMLIGPNGLDATFSDKTDSTTVAIA